MEAVTSSQLRPTNMSKKNYKDFIGKTINDLKIIKCFLRTSGKSKKSYFEYICVCNKIAVARCDAICGNFTKSCGCKTGDLISSKNTLPNDIAVYNKIYRDYKKGAKTRNYVFELPFNVFCNMIKLNCHYCGSAPNETSFSSSKNRKEKTILSNGIDRIDNSVGYTIANSITCCNICNIAKSNRSLKEFQSWIKQLIIFNKGKYGNQEVSEKV